MHISCGASALLMSAAAASPKRCKEELKGHLHAHHECSWGKPRTLKRENAGGGYLCSGTAG